MRRALLTFVLCLLALPLAAALPPGTTQLHFRGGIYAYHLAATPNDAMWAVGIINGTAGRVDLDGTAVDINFPFRVFISAAGTGPDGALWAGTVGFLFRTDPVTNAIRLYSISNGGNPRNLLSGPDGNLWWTQDRLVWRMRISDGALLSTYDAGGTVRGAAFGLDGALYLSLESKLVRITAAGERTEFAAAPLEELYAGPGFFWSTGPRPTDPARIAKSSEIVKLSERGETLATYRIDMVPFASDALGNLWLRATTAEGEIAGQLSPSGVLTRFGPQPALGSSNCHPRYYGGMAFLSDGRVAMSDFYPEIAQSTISPCFKVLRPADWNNSVTILDPRIAPVLSIEPLNRTPRRRTVRR